MGSVIQWNHHKTKWSIKVKIMQTIQIPTPCSPARNRSSHCRDPGKNLFVTSLPDNVTKCCTCFLQEFLGCRNYVEKPIQPVFRFNMTIEPEGAPLIITRLFLTLFIVTGQQPMKHNGQIHDFIWVVANDFTINVHE